MSVNGEVPAPPKRKIEGTVVHLQVGYKDITVPGGVGKTVVNPDCKVRVHLPMPYDGDVIMEIPTENAPKLGDVLELEVQAPQ